MCVVLPVVDVGDYASRLTLMPARSGDQSEGNSVSTRDRHDTRCVKSNGHHRCIGVHSTVRSSEVNRHRVHDAVKNVVFPQGQTRHDVYVTHRSHLLVEASISPCASRCASR